MPDWRRCAEGRAPVALRPRSRSELGRLMSRNARRGRTRDTIPSFSMPCDLCAHSLDVAFRTRYTYYIAACEVRAARGTPCE